MKLYKESLINILLLSCLYIVVYGINILEKMLCVLDTFLSSKNVWESVCSLGCVAIEQ